MSSLETLLLRKARTERREVIARSTSTEEMTSLIFVLPEATSRDFIAEVFRHRREAASVTTGAAILIMTIKYYKLTFGSRTCHSLGGSDARR